MKKMKTVDQTLVNDVLRYAELSMKLVRLKLDPDSGPAVEAEKEMQGIILRTGMSHEEISDLVEKGLTQGD